MMRAAELESDIAGPGVPVDYVDRPRRTTIIITDVGQRHSCPDLEMGRRRQKKKKGSFCWLWCLFSMVILSISLPLAIMQYPEAFEGLLGHTCGSGEETSV